MSDVALRTGLAGLAAQVTHRLAKPEMLNGRAFIQMPILYPSGSAVVAVIEEEGPDRYRVSDGGQAYDEADLAGHGGTYRREAREVAQLSGLTLDGVSLLLTPVTAAQLPAALAIVASASVRALDRAMARVVDRPKPAAVARLIARLGSVFPKADIRPDEELRGMSTHLWRFDALVHLGGRRAAFSIVTPNATSVAFASAKFHDIAGLDPPMRGIAVVHRKAALGDLLGVVAQAARVIEDDAADGVFERALAA